MEMSTLTKTFLSQGTVIVSIVVSSILGYNYLGDRTDAAIERAFDNKCKPLIEDNIVLKAFAKENRDLITGNTKDINNTMLSVNIFIDAYNRKYSKEFLRPADMELQSYKRRK